MGPPNYLGQRTTVYNGLHKKGEGSRARADTKDAILYEMRCGNGSQCNTPAYIGRV